MVGGSGDKSNGESLLINQVHIDRLMCHGSDVRQGYYNNGDTCLRLVVDDIKTSVATKSRNPNHKKRACRNGKMLLKLSICLHTTDTLFWGSIGLSLAFST